jgi:hypothetical protein
MRCSCEWIVLLGPTGCTPQSGKGIGVGAGHKSGKSGGSGEKSQHLGVLEECADRVSPFDGMDDPSRGAKKLQSAVKKLGLLAAVKRVAATTAGKDATTKAPTAAAGNPVVSFGFGAPAGAAGKKDGGTAENAAPTKTLSLGFGFGGDKPKDMKVGSTEAADKNGDVDGEGNGDDDNDDDDDDDDAYGWASTVDPALRASFFANMELALTASLKPAFLFLRRLSPLAPSQVHAAAGGNGGGSGGGSSRLIPRWVVPLSPTEPVAPGTFVHVNMRDHLTSGGASAQIQDDDDDGGDDDGETLERWCVRGARQMFDETEALPGSEGAARAPGDSVVVVPGSQLPKANNNSNSGNGQGGEQGSLTLAPRTVYCVVEAQGEWVVLSLPSNMALRSQRIHRSILATSGHWGVFYELVRVVEGGGGGGGGSGDEDEQKEQGQQQQESARQANEVQLFPTYVRAQSMVFAEKVVAPPHALLPLSGFKPSATPLLATREGGGGSSSVMATILQPVNREGILSDLLNTPPSVGHLCQLLHFLKHKFNSSSSSEEGGGEDGGGGDEPGGRKDCVLLAETALWMLVATLDGHSRLSEAQHFHENHLASTAAAGGGGSSGGMTLIGGDAAVLAPTAAAAAAARRRNQAEVDGAVGLLLMSVFGACGLLGFDAKVETGVSRNAFLAPHDDAADGSKMLQPGQRVRAMGRGGGGGGGGEAVGNKSRRHCWATVESGSDGTGYTVRFDAGDPENSFLEGLARAEAEQGETAGTRQGSDGGGGRVFAHSLRWKLMRMDQRRVAGEHSIGLKVKCWVKSVGQWKTGVVKDVGELFVQEKGRIGSGGGDGGKVLTLVTVELDKGLGEVELTLEDEASPQPLPSHLVPLRATPEWRRGLIDRLRQATQQKVEAEKKGGGRTQRKQWAW